MVAEKYAITEDLDEIIRGDQKEKERGHDSYAIGLAGSDIKNRDIILIATGPNSSRFSLSLTPRVDESLQSVTYLSGI